MSTPLKRIPKEKTIRHKEDKIEEEEEVPKYRDRAKERREDQNPDYEAADLGSFHAVAPPGSVDIRASEAHKLSIENSKYLGGDVEHTHLVKGLDYALLNKVRTEIDKKPESGDEDVNGKSGESKEEQPISFRAPTTKTIYQWIVKPLTAVKANEMFLPARMSFIFNMEGGFSSDIPTTLHRSKADCPAPEEMVTVGVDGSVLDRITKIMSYLRLGASGKVLKKKKKERDVREKVSSVSHDLGEAEKGDKRGMAGNKNEGRVILGGRGTEGGGRVAAAATVAAAMARAEEDDIFVGDGVDYSIPSGDGMLDDMDESPNNRRPLDYAQPPDFSHFPPQHDWQHVAGGREYQQWEEYREAVGGYEVVGEDGVGGKEGMVMTQEEKDRGLGSVFKRDDQRLQQLREKDSREKDPNFISESYSECYPNYQEYNREVIDSDDEADLSKMDMGGRGKGRKQRWDFESEEEWAAYNQQKEAMPKAAFQFGVKMQDGRKTRKQQQQQHNKREQKLTNDLHNINRILSRNHTPSTLTPPPLSSFSPTHPMPPPKKLRLL